MKKYIVLTMAVCLLLAAGCSAVQMSPSYRQTVEASAIRVAELNKRCQAGDEAACKEGLDAASKTLNLIVDAMEGNYDD